MKSSWNHHEISMKSYEITMKSSWNHHEISMKSPWNQHEISMKSPLNHHEISMKSAWNHGEITTNITDSHQYCGIRGHLHHHQDITRNQWDWNHSHAGFVAKTGLLKLLIMIYIYIHHYIYTSFYTVKRYHSQSVLQRPGWRSGPQWVVGWDSEWPLYSASPTPGRRGRAAREVPWEVT